MGEAL